MSVCPSVCQPLFLFFVWPLLIYLHFFKTNHHIGYLFLSVCRLLSEPILVRLFLVITVNLNVYGVILNFL